MASEINPGFDDMLRIIAKNTMQAAEVDDLGGALRIDTNLIKGAQNGNMYGTTHMGTLDMLRNWRKGQKPTEEVGNMRAALKKAGREGLLNLFNKEFPDADTGNQGSAAQTPAFTQGAFTVEPSEERRFGSTDLPDGKVQSCSSYEKWQGSSVKKALEKSEEELKSEEKMNYIMWKSHVKGKALIIGNGNFTVNPRPWVKMDINNMGTLFESLGYSFQNERDERYVYQDLSAEDMNKAISQFTTELKNVTPEPQSAVVYISSHGSEQGITGIDGKVLSIQDLLQHFCKVLPGKPKVIIVDACWGGVETLNIPASVPNFTGARPSHYLPENADIFMIHSTSYGKMAWSYIKHGSWFVDELCKVVYDQSRQLEDLDTIMLRVTEGIFRLTGQIPGGKPSTQSTTVLKQGVTRKLFFYPGFYI